ncbi:MAG: hypothetical protein ABI367_14110 [Mucilaginibacter sp.]
MSKEYDFIIASNHEYEKVFVEIYWNGKFVALINQENGLDNLEIEFPGLNLIESLIERKLPLNIFLDLVKEAAELL